MSERWVQAAKKMLDQMRKLEKVEETSSAVIAYETILPLVEYEGALSHG